MYSPSLGQCDDYYCILYTVLVLYTHIQATGHTVVTGVYNVNKIFSANLSVMAYRVCTREAIDYM